MNRLLVSTLCVALAITACGFNKEAPTNLSTNQPTAQNTTKDSPAKTEATSTPSAGELQPGQASGTYTAKGAVVELKYAYAGRAVRFGTESLVVILTEKPLAADAVTEEIKNSTLLESEAIRGLEYVIDENSMWVRYHPGQYQESGSNKLKDYKVENGVVRGVDENDGDLSDGKYARKVKFVAAIAK